MTNWLYLTCRQNTDHQMVLYRSKQRLLLLTWISNHMSIKVQNENIYPISNFDGCIILIWEMDNKFHPTHYDGYIYAVI